MKPYLERQETRILVRAVLLGQSRLERVTNTITEYLRIYEVWFSYS